MHFGNMGNQHSELKSRLTLVKKKHIKQLAETFTQYKQYHKDIYKQTTMHTTILIT
jgi:hypothetical protein